MTARAREEGFLARIISTVSSSLDLGEVLQAVVGLLSDASAVRACFVYMLDDDGRRLVLKAASEPYGHLVDRIVMERGEGLAWWAAERREPAFIRERAIEDPRTRYFPELEEERFQSLVAVPLIGKDGDLVGAVTAHTEAPREFTPEEVEFLVTVASLVAGAIENARLYEGTRSRVSELEALTELAEAIAGADTLDELLPAAVDGARALLGASTCHLYLIEPGGEELSLSCSSPRSAEAPARMGLAELGSQLAPRRRRGTLSVPLVAESELVGVVLANDTANVDLARALAGQLAVGIRKVRLIERLTERNLIKDFLDELASGRSVADLDGRATRLGWDLALPHVVIAAEPVGERVESALRAALPGSLLDRRGEAVRGLVRLPRGGVAAVVAALEGVVADGGCRIGVSSACVAPADYAGAFDEARHARAGASILRSGSPVVTYEELGAYKYLLRIAADSTTRDSTVEAVGRLAAYDAERNTQLLATLEEFLHRHGSITATSDALYVHPNTLRQRLRRSADSAEIDLPRDDWLMVEIAVKLVRLREGQSRPHTADA